MIFEKDFHDPDNHDGVITHLEPDILEFEVKWALESITTNKASGGDPGSITGSGRSPGEGHLLLTCNLKLPSPEKSP